MNLEESSGTEESDFELLKDAVIIDNQEDSKQCTSNLRYKVHTTVLVNYSALLKIPQQLPKLFN